MLERWARRLYERLGRHYPLVFLAIQAPAAAVVALAAALILASFYDPSTGDVLVIFGATVGFTVLGVGIAIWRTKPDLRALQDWREHPDPGDEATVQAWLAATTFPMRSYRRDSATVNAIAAVPSVAVMVAVLELPWHAGFVILAAGLVAAAYATILNYSLAEILTRPLVEDIAAELPEGFLFQRTGLPLRKRLVIGLPVFTALTGLTVAALVTEEGGTGLLLASVAASVGVGLALSWELTNLLTRAITDPLAQVRQAMTRVTAGDYGVRVPVVTSDELGEVSDAFNRMAAGLEERERLRKAFGTYLDKEVAGFILSGRFPEEGVEVDVSIMFCDVADFTPFAERSDARSVVAALNGLFETIVPVIARHGGHVDKFLGDGLLAVFGAPEGFMDHADRALAAGREIVEAVNRPGAPLEVRVGINSGRVVAGSIGGAGRLNFSVIGDAVNTAARVEAATRETGDALLVTAATQEALTRPVALEPRGSVALKGKREPCEVLALPSAPGRPPEAEPAQASTAGPWRSTSRS